MKKDYTKQLIKERLKKIFKDEQRFVHPYWRNTHVSFEHPDQTKSVKTEDGEPATIKVSTTVYDFAENFESKYYDLLDSEALVRLFEYFIRAQVDRQKQFYYL